jgi:hypothetical protein
MHAYRSTFSLVLAAVLFLGGVLSPWVHRLQHAESSKTYRTVATVVEPAERSLMAAADGKTSLAKTSLPTPPSRLAEDDGTEAELHHCFWCQFHVTGWPEAAGADNTLPRVVDAVSGYSHSLSLCSDRRLSIRGPPGVSPSAVVA